MNLSITLEQPDKKLALFGSADRYLRMIRDTFGVQIVNREDELRLAGEREQVSKAAAVLEQMQRKLRRQDWLSVEDVGRAIGRAADEKRERDCDVPFDPSSPVILSARRPHRAALSHTLAQQAPLHGAGRCTEQAAARSRSTLVPNFHQGVTRA